MQIAASSKPLMLIPVTGPAGVDPTQFPAQVAVMPDGGGEPGSGDWHTGVWVGGEMAITIGAAGATIPLAQGFWFAWVKVDTGSEVLVLPSGRIRVGDPRL